MEVYIVVIMPNDQNPQRYETNEKPEYRDGWIHLTLVNGEKISFPSSAVKSVTEKRKQ